MARVRFPVGANEISNINFFISARLAQLAARRSHNPKVASSILALSILNLKGSIGAVGSATVLCTVGRRFEPAMEHIIYPR